MSASASGPPAPGPKPAIRASTILLIAGTLALVAGIILVAVPDRTLKLLGFVAGIYLIVVGVTELVRAAQPGLLSMERAKHGTVGFLAVVAGIVVVVRPDSSVRAVTVVLGIFLVVVGLAGLVDRLEAEARGVTVLRAVLALVAGILLIVAPSKSAEFAVILVGIYLLVLAVVQLVAGWRLRRLER